MKLCLSETTAAQLDALETEWAEPHLDAWTRPYFPLPAGVEHYRLLAHLSHQAAGRLVLDVGTFHGASALALSACPETRVISFDLQSYRTRPIERANIEFHLADVMEYPYLLESASLILLDTLHEGDFERAFYQRLEEVGFLGHLLLDDIFLNEPMQDFWHSIPRPKQDLTALGHWSGTGLVSFAGRERDEESVSKAKE